MKRKILIVSTMFFTFSSLTAQITNTFPLDDSVGIGTTSPVALFHVASDRIQLGARNFNGTGGFAIGQYTLQSNTTGSGNTAVGDESMRYNTTGSYNTTLGMSALENNISGTYNIAIGLNCMILNVGGSYNTALGFGANHQAGIGNHNTAIGMEALYDCFKGSYNTAIGDSNMGNTGKGNNNTSVGAIAMTNNTLGSNNTIIGYDAETSSGNLNNASAFGNTALVDASNKVRIGNASVSSNGGQVSWTAYSDARIKTKVKENVPGLEFINLLKPVTYHFDVDKQNEIMGVTNNEKVEGMYDIEKITFTGFLAQDVETAAKKINYDFSGLDKSGEILGLRYAEFVVPLVKAVQELSTENSELESRITQLEKLISKQGIVLNDATTEEIYKQSATIESEAYTATLAQNVPNPFAGTTSIAYYVPETAQQAHIKIANANGVSLFMAEVRLGNGVLEVDATQLAAGTYSYTLLVDGKVVDTKLMVFIK